MVGESVDYHDRVLFHFLENIWKNNASKTEVVNEVDKYFLSHITIKEWLHSYIIDTQSINQSLILGPHLALTLQ